MIMGKPNSNFHLLNRRQRPLFFAALFLLPVIILFSCDRNMLYDQFNRINREGWTWSDIQEFSPVVEDTLSYYDIYLQVRHRGNYPVSNLYMFVHLKGPHNQAITDTVNFILARPDGTWNGKGLGDLKELRLQYKRKIRFPEPGTYRISVEQGMRIPSVPVSDVGVRIVKSEE